MLKVLLITSTYPSPYNPVAGIFVRELALALRQLGVDLRVVALYGRIVWPFHKMRRYRFAIDDKPINPVLWVLYHKLRYLPGNVGITVRARFWSHVIAKKVYAKWPGFRPDVVHAQTFIPGAIVGNDLAKRFGCGLLVSTHGADTRSGIKKFMQRIAILKLCRKAKAVVCVGESIRNRLLEYGVDEDTLHVIYNEMDLSKVHKGPNPIAEKYRDSFLVVGVGNLRRTKGFDLFIDAIRQLKPQYPDLHGLIVGDGGERQKLQEQIERLQLKGTIELVGAKLAAETMAYMDACDLFCLPSWSEGFGIVYLEAMAHAKCIIAVEGQGIADIVREHKTGILVPPHDATAVNQAIKILIDDPVTRNRMAQNGKTLVHERVSWQHCASQLIELYENVLKNQTGK